MNPFEQFAVDHFLCSGYPEGKTFGEILELVEQDKLTVWEPFENYSMEDVVEKIQDLATQLESKFIPK